MKNAAHIAVFIFLSVALTLLTAQGQAEEPVKVPIIVYHNIAYDITDEDVLVTVTPQTFREHMQAIKNAGYTPITFGEYYSFVQNGTPLPKNPIMINFDDGYLSNYTYAYPLLREMGMKATFFIVTDTVGADFDWMYPHFTWEQAREMDKSGVIDIQSHSHTHVNLTEISGLEAVTEIRLSKYLIETNLNKECAFFAYPYGASSEITVYLAETAGYKMQMLFGNNGYNVKETPLHRIERLIVRGDYSGAELISFVEQILTNEPE